MGAAPPFRATGWSRKGRWSQPGNRAEETARFPVVTRR